MDGELVTDQEPDGSQVVRYLAFDLLAHNGQNIIKKPLRSRLAVSSDFTLGDKMDIYSRKNRNADSRQFIWRLLEITAGVCDTVQRVAQGCSTPVCPRAAFQVSYTSTRKIQNFEWIWWMFTTRHRH